MVAPVVCGVDESASARRAALRAAALAKALGAPLHVVSAVVKTGPFTSSGVGTIDFTADSLSVADDMLSALVQELGIDQVTKAVVVDDPWRALCREAERIDAQLIVIGNRRVQGVARILGSVAIEVVRHAPCDVYIADTTG